MTWVVVILIIAILAICVILQMKIKHIREQEAESKLLLDDYQKRVNEMEKLLADYRSLEQNFDNVGQGYEQALLAFDKMEEEKQKVLKVKEAIEKQSSELMAAKQQLEQTMLKKVEMIEKYAESIKQKLDYTHPNAGNIAIMADSILNVLEIEMEEHPIVSDDNVMAQDIAALAIQESGIDKFQKGTFKCQMVEEAQATMVFTNTKQAVRALVAVLDNAMKFTAQGEILMLINIEGSNLEFCVEDSGPGVLTDYAEKIFEPYTKLNDFFDGYGVGLTVARSIARRLGGDIRLDTEYRGGARFIFSLPI